MKLFKRYTDITPQDEMHLMVDHGLEPFEIDEMALDLILIQHFPDASTKSIVAANTAIQSILK